MTNEVAKINPAAESPPRLPSLQAGGQVRAIVPTDFDGAWRIANAVVRSGMAPKDVTAPEQAMVVILHGMEVGLPPMAALQSIACINGRPSLWGDGALGVVQSSGLLEWHKEYFTGEDGKDNWTAVCEVKRRDDPNVHTARFSIADAKAAGLYNKKGPWSEYRRRMLQMRARSWALRDGFSDVLRGMHIAEEAMDIPVRDAGPRDVTPRKTGGPPPPDAVSGGDAAPEAAIIEGEVVTTQPAQDADATAQAATPADDGIPESLRRRPAAEEAEKPQGLPMEEEKAWLNDVQGAFSSCEDMISFGEKQRDVMMPYKARVSSEAWLAAQRAAEDTFKRIQAAG